MWPYRIRAEQDPIPVRMHAFKWQCQRVPMVDSGSPTPGLAAAENVVKHALVESCAHRRIPGIVSGLFVDLFLPF